ncbi:UDP-galactose/UDP-glucose transporter 7, partial [Mucuna pruriens]
MKTFLKIVELFSTKTLSNPNQSKTEHKNEVLKPVSYGFASMAMVFINKVIIMEYTYSMTLLICRSHKRKRIAYFSISCLPINWLPPCLYPLVEKPDARRELDMTTVKQLLPLSIFYNANVGFALASLKGFNIPMFFVIKRLMPLAVVVAGKGETYNPGDSFNDIDCHRVLIAALGDFSFDLFGYSTTFTMYLVLVEKFGAEDGLPSVEIRFYNNILSLPFFMFLITATGEFPNSLSVLFAK